MKYVEPETIKITRKLEEAKESFVSALENLVDHTPDPLLRKRIRAFCREFKRKDSGFNPADAAGIAMLKR